MKVRAKRLGFYNNRRWRVGQEFHLNAEKEFSEKWMEKVSTAKGRRSAKPAAAAVESTSDEPLVSSSDDSVI